MSNPNQPEYTTSVSGAADSNAPAIVPISTDTVRPGIQTWQQWSANSPENAAAAAAAAAPQAAPTPAPATSQGVRSVTATIDYHSLATAAMSRLNGLPQ